jgi:hypothetical protein
MQQIHVTDLLVVALWWNDEMVDCALVASGSMMTRA